MQTYVDIPLSDDSAANVLRISPQIPYDKTESVISMRGISGPNGSNLFLTDKEVDDLLTVLEFYKHEKITKGTWYGVS